MISQADSQPLKANLFSSTGILQKDISVTKSVPVAYCTFAKYSKPLKGSMR